MNAVDFVNLCRSKRAAALMTPEAMQAAAPQPPPMDPAMAQGGMPPQGAPMPPQGAPMPPPPMDPAMAQGGAPAGAPPPGAPMPPQMDPAALEQMFIEFAASQGITLDPQTGGAFDANGQPVPPEVIQQLMMQFEQMLAQGGGMPPPADPAMGGAPAGAPPPGAPMDPSMMPPPEGMPPEAAPPMEQGPDMAQLMADIQNNIESMVKAELSAQDKKIAAMMDKIDSMKSLLEQLVGTQDQRTAEDKKSD